MSKFIVFEGIEGSGKTTQARILYRQILKADRKALLTFEPGGTLLGGKIRRLLKKSGQHDIEPLPELFLFMAARSQLVNTVIRPGLQKGINVICDRYIYSSVVYQGYGRHLPLELINELNNIATGGLLPDLVILLDMPVEKGLFRKGSGKYDRFENENIDFHNNIRKGYFALAEKEPERWLTVDGSLPKQAIADIIWDRVKIMMGISNNV